MQLRKDEERAKLLTLRNHRCNSETTGATPKPQVQLRKDEERAKLLTLRNHRCNSETTGATPKPQVQLRKDEERAKLPEELRSRKNLITNMCDSPELAAKAVDRCVWCVAETMVPEWL